MTRSKYIKRKYLPKGVNLKQYYHLRQDDVKAILKHWIQRQDDGKVPLRFRKVTTDADLPNEPALEDNEVQEDLQGYSGSEAQVYGELQGEGSSSLFS